MPLVSGMPLFVVPRNNQAMLCTVEQGRLVEGNSVPVPINEYNVKLYETNDAGWIVWIPEDLPSIGCCHSDAEPHEQHFPPLPLPPKHDPDALAFNRDILYVAGSRALGFFDFNEIERGWQLVPGGKPTDCHGGLSCNDRQLIVGEQQGHDLVLHSFDVKDPRQPASRRRETVFPLWNTDCFTRIALGDNWLAALVEGYGFGGEGTHILLFDPHNLQEYGAIHVTLAHSFLVYNPEPIVNPPLWSDIAFKGDRLFIAAGPRGVGVLDLRGIAKPPQPRRSREEYNRDFCQECEGRLFYVPLPENVSDSVVRVFPVPTTEQVIAVFHGEKFDSVLLDVVPRQ